VGVYTPVEGKEQTTEEFYRELQQSIDKIPKTENIILAGDDEKEKRFMPAHDCKLYSIYELPFSSTDLE
jgi:hypothetical protein